jgi:magnesium-protoporphyrin IX monomethyl ester (oxidative) cyclase
MVSSITKSESAGIPAGIKAPVQETLLTPRFYITDFDAVAQMNLYDRVADDVAHLFTALH